MDISMDTPADYTDNDGTSVAAHCFPVPDPLALELCASASAGPPTWVNPMLEELTASLVVRQPVGAPVPGCPTTLVATSQEEASLLDTHSPATTAQWTTEYV